MHGLGNDYIIIDNRNHIVKEKDITDLAIKLCKRRFSIGADGLLVLYNSSNADLKMRIFNSDGTEAEMCGNGIRCFAKYCYEKKLFLPNKKMLEVETVSGTKNVMIKAKRGKAEYIIVDMGSPIIEKEKNSVIGKGKCVNEKLVIDDETFKITCLSVGNPHCVIFVDDVEKYPVDIVGSKIEKHPLFPNRTNVEFAERISKNELKVRVWERGVGETLACGTGACAVAVAENLLGNDTKVFNIILPGGILKIEYDGIKLLMIGPAEKVFEGNVEYISKN
jgi:diaminopimelate epimerase